MQISVVIPTYNGAKKIPNILKSLAQQTFSNFETIVVVDGSTDNTVEILEQGGNWGLQDFKFIVQANGGRASVRNKGAKEAKGNLLLFFDDDMRALPTLLERHQSIHNLYPNIILVGNVPEDLALTQTDFQHYKAFLSRKWVAPLNQINKPLDKNSLFLTAANLSIPKNIFEQLGGFDARLKDAEDFDLGVRALLQKTPIHFDIEAIAWHDDFVTCRSYIQRQRQYKKAHEVLLALKPEVYSVFNQHQPKQRISSLKKAVYWLFGQKIWIKIIDQTTILKIFPKKIRYKIYEWVVYSFANIYNHKNLS